jgi:hypothetical protein
MVAGCDKAFSQRQQLNRHKLSQHDRCAKHYHCTTEGCKYAAINEFGKAGAKFTREDHLKTHIKEYGHYGPFSPVDRKKRRWGEIQDAIRITVFFEECIPSGRMSEDCHRRTTKHDTFESTKTKLWHRDEKGSQYVLGSTISATDIPFYCCYKGCYYNQCPPEGVPQIGFRTLEQLEQHGRITGHGTLYECEGNGQNGATVDKDTSAGAQDGHTPPLSSSWSGHEAVVRLLLEQKADVDAKDTSGRTALSRAAEMGHEAVVRLLLEQKADVDAKDTSGRTALSRAAEMGHEAVVRLLLEQKADVDAKDTSGRTALSRAAEMGHEAVVRLLLEQKADVDAEDGSGKTALHLAAIGCHVSGGRPSALVKGLEPNLTRDQYHLKMLPYADDAPFNSYSRQHEPTCLPKTRVDILQKISQWAEGEDQQCLFWLSGMAGTGKSTIARTIARTYFDQDRLAASFFFSRGVGDVGNASKFVATLAVQLTMHIPPIQRHIHDVLIERSTIFSQSLADQWRQLVLEPLLKLDGKDTYSSYVMIIDALDECEGENDIRIILRLLAEVRSLKKVRLRVLITSRPEISIRYGFCQIPDSEHHDFILHDIEAAILDHDISIFLDYEMRLIRQERSLEAGWPGELVIEQLVQKASGLFIWAATACRFMRKGRRFVRKPLDIMLQGDKSITGPENHLNRIYLAVLKNSFYQIDTEQEKKEQYNMLREILGSIIVLFSPLSAASLATLLHIPKEDVYQILEDLHSILDIPEDQTRPLRLHHPSFRDFLLDKDRSSNLHFWVDEREIHQTLANNCIQLMCNNLKQDMCGQEAPGTLVAEVESSRIDHCLPPEVRYACLYWIQHLQRSNTQLCDNGQVHQFLQQHLLHWLEALGWIGKTSEGILAILSLEAQILVSLIFRYET